MEDRFEETGHGRLGDGAEGQRADGDAELRGGHHLRQVLQTVQDLLGPGAAERLDLAAADGDERELGPDEEAVRQDEEDGEEELQGAHRTASAGTGAWAGARPGARAGAGAAESVSGPWSGAAETTSGPGAVADPGAISGPGAVSEPGAGAAESAVVSWSVEVRTIRTRSAR